METALYKHHLGLQAKMVDFFGWKMPLHYPKGIIFEHQAVRNHVGLFDVSHMGCISIYGKDREPFMNYLCVSNVSKMKPHSVLYTVWCNEGGFAVDDLLLFKEEDRFIAVCNASNRESDLKHLRGHVGGFDVEIVDHFKEEGILALQGPSSKELLEELFQGISDLKKMHFNTFNFLQEKIIISQTGYTGSLGYEIYGKNKCIVALWELLLEKGRKYQIEPVGLGARDTLRLEMGYALYGHELGPSILPTESVAAWTVHDDHAFLGQDVLMKNKPKRKSYGVILKEGIARDHYAVLKEGRKIGEVTSGTYSPSLQLGIALLLSDEPLEIDDRVNIEIRGKHYEAKVSALPLFKEPKT